MSRQNEIDKFIKEAVKYYKKNNRLPIYTFLQNYKIPEFEQKKYSDLRQSFNDYISHFSNNPNMNCYWTEIQPKFLQFDTDEERDSKDVKLYINLKPEAQNKGIKLIFDYIANNKMRSHSKIADRLRSDGIVLRMPSMADAEKVINYINTNPYLSWNARPTNPFLNRAGVVGVAFDDYISYNCTVSDFLSDYIFHHFDTASYEGFVKYMEEKYRKVFFDKTELNEFVSSRGFIDDRDRISEIFGYDATEFTLNNYKSVIQTIIINLKSNNYKDVFTVINSSRLKQDNNVQHGQTEIIQQVDKTELVSSFVKYNLRKTGVMFDSIKALYSLLNNDYHGITRDRNYRQLFIDNIKPQDIINITGGNINGYVQEIASRQTQLIDEMIVTEDDLNLFLFGCKATYNKYGYDQLKQAIPEFINGNIQPMTNDEYNSRDMIKSMYKIPSQIKKYCIKCFDYLMKDRQVEYGVPVEDQIMQALMDAYSLGGQTR